MEEDRKELEYPKEEKQTERLKEGKRKKKREKSTIRGFLYGIIFMLALFAAFLFIPISPKVSNVSSLLTYKKLFQAKQIIDQHFIGDVDEQTLTDYVFVGLMAGLQDKYAAYYTKEEYDNLLKSQNGYYTGIGVSIANRTEDGALIVMSVTSDGPAEKAGIKAEDVILSINGEDASEMTSTQATEIVQSAEGEITLKIRRESSGEEFEVSMEKENLETESVTGEILENSIGYIKISSFTAVTAKQFKNIYTDMQEKGIESLIVDLRDNPGGLVSGVCDTMEEILPKGIMVYTVDKYGNRTDRSCSGENEIEIPMAVLINGNTASAAEIFSGAVQDYEVGTIVGMQSYGKGIVQDVYRLSDGSVIKLTVSHYYTPNGNDIHEQGITPDEVVEDDESTDTDEQLEKAISILKEK